MPEIETVNKMTLWSVMLALPGHSYDLQAICTSSARAAEIVDALQAAGLYGARAWAPLSSGRHWVAVSTIGPLILRVAEETTLDAIRPRIDERELVSELILAIAALEKEGS